MNEKDRETSSELRLRAAKKSRSSKLLKLDHNRARRLPGLGQRLMRQLEVFRALMEQEGIKIRIEPGEYARELFFRLSLGSQRRIVMSFSNYVDLIYSLKRKGIDLHDCRRLTWAFLRKMQFQPCSDLFARIEDGDVIEIYNRDYVQIFRNLKFFELCQCSIFDLLVVDWMTIFKRSAQIEQKMFFQVESDFKNPARVKSFEGVSKHPVTARFQGELREFELSPKIHASLINRRTRSKRVDAVLVTSAASRGELSFLERQFA